MSLFSRLKTLWALSNTRVPSSANNGCDNSFVCPSEPTRENGYSKPVTRKMAQIIKRKSVDPIDEIVQTNGDII